MPRESFPQNSFTAGEISDDLKARNDFDQYHKALDRAKNVIVKPTGGITRRDGTEYIDEIPIDSEFFVNNDEHPFQLINFSAREDESYITVLTHDGNDAQLILYNNDKKTTLDGSNSDVYLPYNTRQISEVDWVQKLDKLILLHKKYKPVEITRAGVNNFNANELEIKNIPEYAFSDPGRSSKKIDTNSYEVCNDILWNNDGSKFYELLYDDINYYIGEYDISGSGYILPNTLQPDRTYKISTPSVNNIQEMEWGKSGNKLYIVDKGNEDIYEYNAGTAYDATSLSYNSKFDISNFNPTSVEFKNDGTKMYVTDNNKQEIKQYALSTAWEITTASLEETNVEKHNYVITTDPALSHHKQGLEWSPDGTKMFMLFDYDESEELYKINSYKTSDAYQVENMALDKQRNLEFPSSSSRPEGMFWGTSESFFTMNQNGKLFEYFTSSNYNIDNISEQADNTYSPTGVNFDTYKGATKWTGDKSAHIALGTINGETYIKKSGNVTNNEDTKLSEISDPKGLHFDSNKNNLYVIDGSGPKVYQYTFDVSGGNINTSLVGSKSLEGTNPTAITINEKNDILYELQSDNEIVETYKMSVKNDVTTASSTYGFTISKTMEDESVQNIQIREVDSQVTDLHLFELNKNNAVVYEYHMTGDINNTNLQRSLKTNDPTPKSIIWNDVGDRMYEHGSKYNLTIQYDAEENNSIFSISLSTQDLGQDEIQYIDFDNMADKDSYDISLEGEVSTELRWDADSNSNNAERIQGALRRMANTGNSIEVTPKNDGLDKYEVRFKEEDGRYNWDNIIVSIFTGDGSASVTEIRQGKNTKENVWGDLRGWPKHGAFYQQRLYFAGSDSLPETVWASKVGEPFNFDLGDGESDDAIQATLNSDQVSEITWIKGGQNLFIGTGLTEYYVEGEPVTPESFRIVVASKRGSKSNVKAIASNESIYYVSKSKSSIRELSYSFDISNYQSKNISVLSKHLINNPESMTYKQAENKNAADIFYCINEDGNAAAMSILKSEDVQGFTELTTKGDYIKSRAQNEDNYFIVRRNVKNSQISDNDKKENSFYLEKEKKNRIHDSSIKKENPTSETISGLDHLKNKEVDITVDGLYKGTAVVNSSGEVILDKQPDDYVEIGLSIPDPTIKLLEPALRSTTKTMSDRVKRILEVQLYLENTKSLQIEEQVIPFRDLGSNLLDQAAEPFSGKKRVEALPGYSRSPQLTITQPVPQPMTLLEVVQKVTF